MIPSGVNAGPPLIAAVLLMAGCTSLPSRHADMTPVSPTAVQETHVVSTGTRDFPAFESTRVSYTRADKRRHELSVRGRDEVAPVIVEQKDILIERLDRNLALKLDDRNRTAIKCPLASCAQKTRRPPLVRQTGDADRNENAACRLKVGRTTFSVEPTGRKRNVNGFDAQQYDVKWIVSLRDNAARESTSTINIELWTTPVTPTLQDAIAVEKTYTRALDKLLRSPADGTRTERLPSEAVWMINRHLSASVSPSDRKKFLDGAQGLAKVQGHPILMHINWNLAGDACSTNDSMRTSGDKPLLTFRSEVKVHTMAPMHESLFMPPKGWRVTQ